MKVAGCRSLLDHLYELLDGEISEDRLTHLQAHLEECSECLERLGVELHFSLLVRGRCSQVSVPSPLVQRIRDALQAEIRS